MASTPRASPRLAPRGRTPCQSSGLVVPQELPSAGGGVVRGTRAAGALFTQGSAPIITLSRVNVIFKFKIKKSIGFEFKEVQALSSCSAQTQQPAPSAAVASTSVTSNAASSSVHAACSPRFFTKPRAVPKPRRHDKTLSHRLCNPQARAMPHTRTLFCTPRHATPRRVRGRGRGGRGGAAGVPVRAPRARS